MSRSLIYSSVHVYRFMMNVLYQGRYRRRFGNILELLDPGVRSVCDVCFGDVYIAQWCSEHGVEWTGIDLNRNFCRNARRQGFNAIEGDIFSIDLPAADVYVMAGSLYHFHTSLARVFDMVLERTSRFIISEPVRNLSTSGGIIGWWAARSADPGTGDVAFRFNEKSLRDSVERQRERIGFTYRVISVDRDMLLEIVR
jgi:hypothetical protein